VKELCIQDRAARPAHLVTVRQGTAQLESTLRYAPELNEPPYNSPFRPSRFGNFAVRGVRITDQDILIVFDEGTVRLPPDQVAYSYKS
jgi:hypothetical protein